MDGDEVLTVLREIRDEAKQTNVRIDQTNTRLESLEGRFEFIEKRVTKGFGDLSARIEAHADAQAESETRLASAILSLEETIHGVHNLLETKLEDHKMVLQHEKRISSIESRFDDKPSK